MRIHGIQLRGLSAPSGDHQLALDPGYTVLRVSDPVSARRLLALTRALLHPESTRATTRDSSGRAVLTLALRSDARVVAADFARGRLSFAKLEPSGAASKPISGDAREIEAQLHALGFPAAEDFDLLHVFGASGGASPGRTELEREPIYPPELEKPRPTPEPDESVARIEAERARLLAEHEQRVRALEQERSRLEDQLGYALRSAVVDQVRDAARLKELQAREDELVQAVREREAGRAELEASSTPAQPTADVDARLADFRTLLRQHEEERAVVEDARGDLLGDRARLRLSPRKLMVPIALGLALGIAGAAAGAVGYPVGYALSLLGIATLLAAFVATRIVHARLARIETLLAVLRVRERTSERRFETDSAPIRGAMQALGVSSVDDLQGASRGHAEKLERAEAQKRRIAELEASYPAALRAERAELESAQRDGTRGSSAVADARAALKALPMEVPAPLLPELPQIVEPEPTSTDAETAVEFGPKPDEDPELGSESIGPELLLSAASRMLDRSEAELRARLGPILPVYLRALSLGTFTNARPGDSGSWILRGAARDEQPFEALPDRERELVRLALQLALLEALAGDRRVPLLIGPDLPARGEDEQLALARSFKRLSSVVQVIQIATASEPWSEQAGKSYEL